MVNVRQADKKNPIAVIVFLIVLATCSCAHGNPNQGPDGRFTFGSHSGMPNSELKAGTTGSSSVKATSGTPTMGWENTGHSSSINTLRTGNLILNVPSGYEINGEGFVNDEWSKLPSILTRGTYYNNYVGIGPDHVTQQYKTGYYPIQISFVVEHNLQDSELSKEYRDNFDSAATTGEEGITVWGSGTNPRGIGMGALIHELAHVLDGAQQPLEHNKWVYSNTDEYTKAMADDGNFPSDYAEQSTKVYDGTRQKNAEDFADAVSQYMTDHDNFTKKCPHRSSYLKGIIGD